MRNLVYTFASLTDDDNGICASQAKVGAGALTLNGALVSGGVASWTDAQIVTVTSAGNDSGITFTFADHQQFPVRPDFIKDTVQIFG